MLAEAILACREVSLVFLDGDLALEAVRCGWCELPLFGIFDGALEAAKARVAARGLIPTLAWSSIGLAVEAINREHAVLRTRTGAMQKHPRFPREAERAVPWWLLRAIENRELSGEPENKGLSHES